MYRSDCGSHIENSAKDSEHIESLSSASANEAIETNGSDSPHMTFAQPIHTNPQKARFKSVKLTIQHFRISIFWDIR
jgi:hypothetical protein